MPEVGDLKGHDSRLMPAPSFERARQAVTARTKFLKGHNSLNACTKSMF
jgi:hypothetical protein